MCVYIYIYIMLNLQMYMYVYSILFNENVLSVSDLSSCYSQMFLKEPLDLLMPCVWLTAACLLSGL